MKLKYFFCVMLAVILSSCSNIDEAERLIPVSVPEEDENPEAKRKCVLIEDFTGHSCVNCPEAAEIIEELQKFYGEKIVAVGIYSGPMGDPDLRRYKDSTLVTATGKDYWDHWFSSGQGQPVGLINRGGALDKEFWIDAVAKALLDSTFVEISASCDYDAGTREVTFNVSTSGCDGENANLQLWLIENEIIGFQKTMDESEKEVRIYDYHHQHVFRAAVNGTWGEPFTFGEEEKTFDYTYTLDEKWVAENMKLVAFVYNDKGVEQVISVPVVAAPESQE